jgi:hypothetical protein
LHSSEGCGKTLDDYKLFSSDEDVASVSNSRIVSAKKPGQAVIRVVSTFDFLNFDEVCPFYFRFKSRSLLNSLFLLLVFMYFIKKNVTQCGCIM